MMVFGFGALAFASLLGWLTVTELKHDRPTNWQGWAQYVGVVSGIVCTAVVAVRALF